MATARLLGAPSKDTFLTTCNGTRRVRIFDDADYTTFCSAIVLANLASTKGLPFLAQDDTGGVAKSYGYTSSTAQWGVWVDPLSLKVIWKFRQQQTFDGNVPRAHPGGERSYIKRWKTKHGTFNTGDQNDESNRPDQTCKSSSDP